MTATELVQAYYAALNAGDMPAFLDLLADDVVHDLNQGERLEDIVAMQNADGSRAAAEFVVHGEYLADDESLPPAGGQSYVLPAGAFFEIKDGKVARISNHYNLNDWIAQVG